MGFMFCRLSTKCYPVVNLCPNYSKRKRLCRLLLVELQLKAMSIETPTVPSPSSSSEEDRPEGNCIGGLEDWSPESWKVCLFYSRVCLWFFQNVCVMKRNCR